CAVGFRAVGFRAVGLCAVGLCAVGLRAVGFRGVTTGVAAAPAALINYDGRRFRPLDGDPGGEVPSGLYRQDGDLVWVEIRGGPVRAGRLVGHAGADGTLDAAYCMVLAGGGLVAGRCCRTPWTPQRWWRPPAGCRGWTACCAGTRRGSCPPRRWPPRSACPAATRRRCCAAGTST